MGLQQRHRKGLRLGLAETVALGLVALALTPALLYFRASLEPSWHETTGRVVASNIDPVEYSRDPGSRQVELTYEYRAHGQTFTGTWRGFWPQAHSPNALPEAEVHKLQPGYSLTIHYDPVQPSQSLLHYTGSVRPVTYGRITIAALALVLVYLGVVYPRWKHA